MIGEVHALEPPKRITPRPVASGPTTEQKQLTAIAKALDAQEKAQIYVNPVGAVGILLLVATGYLIWGRR